jgi:hypothetical protein
MKQELHGMVSKTFNRRYQVAGLRGLAEYKASSKASKKQGPDGVGKPDSSGGQ